ncbi:hypothetical protein IMX26_10205 [Clostridium sp. 'deep sea']|nr:hypothetical protein [Clostridium sp. 'deep sea']QOR33867.1 hypothetical protein IMX26_10205 [Clostridium sp. 'deep sea']
MKKLFKKSLIISALTALCVLFAASSSAATLISVWDQPKIPKSLIIEE